MERSRLTEEQIIAILKEQEAGMMTAEVCRRHGISPATFHNWKGTVGRLEVSNVRKSLQLEEGNARLKRLLVNTMLDNAMRRDWSKK